MVKVYYTYTFNQVIGQTISKQSNFVVDPDRIQFCYVDKLFIAGVNQYVAIISMKTGEVLQYLFK